jgi:alanine racemase
VDRGITAEVDLAAAEHNLNEIKRTVNNLPVIAVVKADAYGHGARELSRVYERAGVHSLAVAFVSEARELRESGIKAPILVLFDTTDMDAYFDLSLMPVIHDLKAAREFSREATPWKRHLRPPASRA